VHRYVISDITTADVFEIARGFEETLPMVNAAVGAVERRQLELGVGMTRSEDTEFGQEDLLSWAKDKHGAQWLTRAMKRRPTK
jgi:hypothetical protein